MEQPTDLASQVGLKAATAKALPQRLSKMTVCEILNVCLAEAESTDTNFEARPQARAI